MNLISGETMKAMTVTTNAMSTDQRSVSRPQGDDCDTGSYEVEEEPAPTPDSCADVDTATGTGTTRLCTSSGTTENPTPVSESTMPTEGKPGCQFPHGLFSFNIIGLSNGESVTVTLTFPSAIPMGSQYWKYGPTPSDPSPHWYQLPIGDDDGDNVITITLIDNGLGDDVLTGEDGEIVDQGGICCSVAGVPSFPSLYVGIAAAFAAGILAYLLRRRLVKQE